jgi:hypothetical protein
MVARATAQVDTSGYGCREHYSESTTGEQALGSTWQDGGVEYDVLPEGRGVHRSR